MFVGVNVLLCPGETRYWLLMRMFEKMALDIVPIFTQSIKDDYETITLYLQYEFWQILCQCFSKMVLKVLSPLNKVLANLTYLLFRSDGHSLFDHFKPRDCRYQPAKQLFLKIALNWCRWSWQFPKYPTKYNHLLPNCLMLAFFLSSVPMQYPLSICNNNQEQQFLWQCAQKLLVPTFLN